MAAAMFAGKVDNIRHGTSPKVKLYTEHQPLRFGGGGGDKKFSCFVLLFFFSLRLSPTQPD
jgi:hypothetical protein